MVRYLSGCFTFLLYKLADSDEYEYDFCAFCQINFINSKYNDVSQKVKASDSTIDKL